MSHILLSYSVGQLHRARVGVLRVAAWRTVCAMSARSSPGYGSPPVYGAASGRDGFYPPLCFIRIYLKLSLPYTGESARVSTCNSPVVLKLSTQPPRPLTTPDYLSSLSLSL